MARTRQLLAQPANVALGRFGDASIEPFTEFDKLGRGTPKLTYRQNPKTAHVNWGDGLMWDYVEFDIALDKRGMSDALKQAWERHRPQLNKRSQCAVEYMVA